MDGKSIAASQRAIVNAYTLIAMLYCAASSWLYYQIVGMPFLGAVHFVSLAVIGVNYVVLQFTGNYGAATHVILSIGTLVVSSQYATGGWGGTGYLWTFAYLPYLFFLASPAQARLWVILLLAVDGGITAADVMGRLEVPYGPVGHTIFYASLGIFLLCMFLFKGAVLKSEATAERRARELATLNEALQTSEAELTRAQHLAHLGSWAWDPARDRTTWSPEMRNLFGLQVGDPPLTAEAFRRFVHSNDRAAFEMAYERALATGEPTSLDCRIVRADGIERTLHLRGTPERDADGRVVRILGTAQDVTELREVEDQRRTAAIRLQEIDSLKEVNRLKSQFLNSAAHELSTPLTPIKLQLRALQSEHPDPERHRRAVELLDRNVNRLGVLVQDLLESAKLQSNQLAIQRQPVELQHLVDEAARNQAAVAQQKGVRLEVDAGVPLWTVGDARRLAQVLDNLLANAVKFTPSGKSVRVRSVRASGGVAVFVQDEGIGIAASNLPKLFQPFSQIHDTSQQTRAGSGLGLYICKGIVEAHGGRMGVESPGLGKGSTFWFVLAEGQPGNVA